MSTRISLCLRVPLYICVARQAQRIVAFPWQNGISTRKLLGHRVIIASIIVIQAGHRVGALTREAIATRHCSGAVARPTIGGEELSSLDIPTGIEGHIHAADGISRQVGEDTVDRQ